MEPRINHGQPGWLGAWLQDRCHPGFDAPLAKCLYLRVYYRFDGVPMALRHQLSRVTLASTFAEFARRGLGSYFRWCRRRRPVETPVLAAVVDTELSSQRADLRLRTRGSGVSPAPSLTWARRMRLTGAFMTLCALVACGDGDPVSLPPAELSYNGSEPFPAVVGEAIALTPAVSGPIDRYAVSPALPPGLLLNHSTGVISGRPTRVSGPTIFEVTATNRGGHRTFSLVLSVTEPPSNLSYPSPVKGIVGATLAPVGPRIAGTVEHYSVTPALPAGVVLDGKSGLITGTPSVASALAPYTITASSLAGDTSFIFLLAVAAPSPR